MRSLLVTLLVLLAAPAALAQKPEDDKPAARATAVAASPFVGTWDYVVTVGDDEETGTFTIRAEGDHLGGTFVSDTTSPIDPFVMDGDAVAFTFKHPEMNVITIRGTLAGDRFEGEAEVRALEAVFPLVATRQAEAAPASQ